MAFEKIYINLCISIIELTDRFLKIPFDLPEYLAQYLASRIRRPLIESKGNKRLLVDRRSFFGSLIMDSLEVSENPVASDDSALHVLISPHSGDHFKGAPRGKRNFLKINPEKANRIFQYLEDDFNKKLISFVQGAEFAHRENGWTPEQKRKGIRKKAIFEFCIRYEIFPNKKNIAAMVKKCQRYGTDDPNAHTSFCKKIGEVVSL